jgi:hypothetical protein
LALTLLTTASAGAAERPACVRGSVDYARKADLPGGVLQAFGTAMAERGAPFQATDVLGPGPALPGTRFIAARQTGCRLALRFEQGGIAHTYQTAILEHRGGRWVLLERRLQR